MTRYTADNTEGLNEAGLAVWNEAFARLSDDGREGYSVDDEITNAWAEGDTAETLVDRIRGRRLAAARSAAGLTQAQLAARLGVSRETIVRRESGALPITAEAALAIKAALRGDEWTPCDEPAEDEYPRMEVRPRDAGQIVERSYGVWDGTLYRRTEDRSIVGPERVRWHRRPVDENRP